MSRKETSQARCLIKSARHAVSECQFPYAATGPLHGQETRERGLDVFASFRVQLWQPFRNQARNNTQNCGPAVPASPVTSLGDQRHRYLTSPQERPSGEGHRTFQQHPRIRPRSYARRRPKFVLRGSFWRLVHNTTVKLFAGLGWVLGMPGRSPMKG
jgi:hypothetical protein